MFGVIFPNRSFPLDISSFRQVDVNRWLLDINQFLGEDYHQVKEICLFLLSNIPLPLDKALAVYIQAPGSAFEYRGAVHMGCPSAVLPLLWPSPSANIPTLNAPQSALIGISVENLATLPSLNVGNSKRIEELALKVGENLFTFMQSYSQSSDNKIIVPLDIIDRWFKKFQERASKDPDYLNRFSF